MTDYDKIREELHEKHSESFKALYISELKDQIDFLNRSHEALVNIINKREARIEQLEEVLKEIQDKSSLVYEQTRGRLFLINKIAAVALGADPKDFEPGGNEHRAALENK